jgi:hypothetical protein
MHYVMKEYGGVDVQIHVFLNCALIAREWQLHAQPALTQRKRPTCTHWIGGWVDLRAGLDDMQKLYRLSQRAQ